jgi:hypothetical protein
MSSGIASLHKILKDETRQQIVQTLSEKGSLTYTELMSTLGITSTGTLNYHLKILGDLLTKTEDGKYTLTDKGKLASRLLLEFPERQNRSSGFKVGWGDVAWVVLSNASCLSIMVYLWFRGFIVTSWLLSSVIMFAVATVTILLVKTKMPTNRTYSPKRMLLGTRIAYLTFGAIGGILVCWLGGGLVIAGVASFMRSAGMRFQFFSFTLWTIISWAIGAFVGGLVGYLLFKRSGRSNISYYDPFIN